MSAEITSPKEIESLLRIVAAALDSLDCYTPQEIGELIESCDRAANAIAEQRGTIEL